MREQTSDLIVAVTTNRLDFASVVQSVLRSHYAAKKFAGNILTANCDIEQRDCFELESVIVESYRLADAARKQRPEALFSIGTALGEGSIPTRDPYTNRRMRSSFGIVVLCAMSKEALVGCGYRAPGCPTDIEDALTQHFHEVFDRTLRKQISGKLAKETYALADNMCAQLSCLEYNTLVGGTEHLVQ